MRCDQRKETPMRVPVYVKAPLGMRPDAFLLRASRRKSALIALRLAPDAGDAALDVAIDNTGHVISASAAAAVSKASAAMPGASVMATIARVAKAVEAVERYGAPAPITTDDAPDAKTAAALRRDAAAIAASPDAARLAALAPPAPPEDDR
jgi:hypothetical protein